MDQIWTDGDNVRLVLGKFLGCKPECMVVPAVLLRRGHDEVACQSRAGAVHIHRSPSRRVPVHLSLQPFPQRPTATDSRTVLLNPTAGLQISLDFLRLSARYFQLGFRPVHRTRTPAARRDRSLRFAAGDPQLTWPSPRPRLGFGFQKVAPRGSRTFVWPQRAWVVGGVNLSC